MDRHKNLCTHGLSLIVSLCVFLYDGLATHLLVECRMRMNEDEDVNEHEKMLIDLMCCYSCLLVDLN